MTSSFPPFTDCLPSTCHIIFLVYPPSHSPMPPQLLHSIISPVNIHVLPTPLPFSFHWRLLFLSSCPSEVDLWLCFSRGDADGEPAPGIDYFDCDTDRFHIPLLLLLFITLRLEQLIQSFTTKRTKVWMDRERWIVKGVIPLTELVLSCDEKIKEKSKDSKRFPW